MAGRRGDVELVIRAKDAATQALDSVTKAIEQLVGAQNDLSKSSLKTDSTLGQLTTAFAGLEKELRGATVGAQIGKALDTASKAADRLKKSVEATSGELSTLASQQQAAVANSARLTAEMNRAAAAAEKEAAALEKAKKAVADQTGSLRQATSDRKQLEAADARLTEQIGKQAARVQQAQERFAKLSAELTKTATPAKTLQSQFERATASLASSQAKLAELQQTQGVVRAAFDQTSVAVARFAGQLDQANGAVVKQASVLATVKSEYTELQAAVRSAAQQQKTLDTAADATADALGRQNAALEKTRVEFAALEAAAQKSGAALGELAAGSALKLQEAFDRQRRSMLETKREWAAMEAAVKTLAASMTKIGPPTREQAKAWVEATQAARIAKGEYLAQREGLQKLGAVLQETGGDIDALVARQNAFIAIQERTAQAVAQVTVAVEKEAQALQRVASSSQRTVRVPTGGGGTGGVADVPDAGRVDRLSQAYKDLWGNTRLAMSWTQRLRGEVLSLIAAYGGIFGVINALGQVIDAYKQLEAATSRLRVVFDGDQDKTIKELDFLRRTADRLGISFGTLADEYGKFAVATKGTNISASETRKIFTAVSEAGRVNKLSIENMKGVFVALTQIVSKGKVQMEELRQQLGDRLPGAVQIMADALHITTAELFEMTKKGEIGSEALVAFADELEKRFGGQLPNALKTTTTALGQFENAVFQALLAFGKAGFIKSFTDLIKQMTTTLKSADFQQFLIGISKVFATLIDLLTSAVAHFKLLTAVAAGFIAIKLGPVIIALGAAFLRLTGLMAGVRGAVVASVFAMQGLGTAAGLASTEVTALAVATRTLLSATGVGLAITAIAVAMSLWATTATDATEALTDLQTQLDIIKNGFDEANGSADKFAKSLDKVSTAKIRSDLIDLRKQLEELKPQAATGVPVAALTPAFVKTIDEVDNLTKAFNRNLITLDHYRKQLDGLAEAGNDEWLTKFIAGQIEAAEKTDEARNKIKEGEAALKVLAGTATDADKALLDMGGSIKDASDEIAHSAEVLDEWNGLLEDANKALGKAGGSTETFEEKLTSAFQKMAAGVKTLSELNGLINQFNEAMGRSDAGDLLKGLSGADSGGEAGASIIRRFEGFTATPKFDVNHLRAGFGSDTVTLADGTVKEIVAGMKVSVADANRDLGRRIQTYTAEITRKIGADAFGGMTPVQQGVLESIVHNYGELPDRIVKAINNGDDVAEAIRNLGTDNGGVNARRRETEANLFAAGGSPDEIEKAAKEQEKTAKKQADDDEKKAEKAREYHDTLADTILQEAEQNALKQEGILKQEVAKALAEAENRAKAAGTELTKAERQAIIDNTTEKFKEKAATEDIAAAEQRVTDLVTQRNELQKQLAIAKESGDSTATAEITAELKNVNAELLKAIDAAIAFNQAIGGAGADASVAKLKTIAAETKNVSVNAQEAWIDWNRVGQLFASGLTNAFDEFAQAVAAGEDAGEAARKAFLKFASDFLRQIAQMIIQQAIMNALRSFGFGAGGGIGGAVGGLFHSGGVVGRRRGAYRTVDPAIFAGAQRFHDGRLPGLRPGELPAILQMDEEVLSKGDPRNIRNGGAAAGGAGGQGGNGGPMTIANFFDAQTFLDAALSGKVGEQRFLNWVSANPAAVKQAIGV